MLEHDSLDDEYVWLFEVRPRGLDDALQTTRLVVVTRTARYFLPVPYTETGLISFSVSAIAVMDTD